MYNHISQSLAKSLLCTHKIVIFYQNPFASTTKFINKIIDKNKEKIYIESDDMIEDDLPSVILALLCLKIINKYFSKPNNVVSFYCKAKDYIFGRRI